MKKSFKTILIALSLSGMLSGMAYADGSIQVALRNQIDSSKPSDKLTMEYKIIDQGISNKKIELGPGTRTIAFVDRGNSINIEVVQNSKIIYYKIYNNIERNMTIICKKEQHTLNKVKCSSYY